MQPSSIFAPCKCGVFPGATLGYRCLCHHSDESLRSIIAATDWATSCYAAKAQAELDRRTA